MYYFIYLYFLLQIYTLNILNILQSRMLDASLLCITCECVRQQALVFLALQNWPLYRDSTFIIQIVYYRCRGNRYECHSSPTRKTRKFTRNASAFRGTKSPQNLVWKNIHYINNGWSKTCDRSHTFPAVIYTR